LLTKTGGTQRRTGIAPSSESWFLEAGSSTELGLSPAVNSNGRTIFVADAHRDGKHFVVRADEKLTAFVELERAIYDFHRSFKLAPGS
jgi:hypothetical protein